MPNSRSPVVRLVPPRTWQPLLQADAIERAAGPVPQVLRDRLIPFVQRSLLSLHDRHVGVSPELIATLTPTLLDPRQRLPENTPWAAVLARLVRSLLNPEDDADAQHAGRASPFNRAGLLLSRTPVYVLLRLVAPIVELACRDIGRCFLFCADDLDATVTPTEYGQYTAELAAAVEALACNKEDRLDLFWRERSLTLSTLSRPATVTHGQSSPLAAPDAIDAGFLLNLRPAFSERDQEKLRRLTTIQQQRNMQQREEGVAGVRVTRREEDLGNALLSEFLQDNVTRADRFFNTGFLALERDPKRTRLRDVLIVGMLPGAHRGLSADFAKACWFDFSLRLGLILCQFGLQRSEFRWIEGDQHGQMRSCAFLLEQLPEIFSRQLGQPTAPYRHAFLDLLDWLPRFLDRQAPYRPLPQSNHQDGGEPAAAPPSTVSAQDDAIRRWLFGAWAAQLDGDGWATPSHMAGHHLQADAFAYTHIMTFWPAPNEPVKKNEPPQKDDEPRAHLPQLAGGLQARNRFHGGVSLTQMPRQLDDLMQWRIETRRGIGRHLLFTEQDPELSANQLAAALEQRWLDEIVAEVTRA